MANYAATAQDQNGLNCPLLSSGNCDAVLSLDIYTVHSLYFFRRGYERTKLQHQRVCFPVWQIFGDATPHANFVRADMRKGASAVPAKSQQYTELVDEAILLNALQSCRDGLPILEAL
eukprot:4313756-Pleurochrysis_carterae.AAC.5